MGEPLSQPVKGTVRLTSHRPIGPTRIDPSTSVDHVDTTGGKIINHAAPIAVQKQRDDGGFDNHGTLQDGIAVHQNVRPGDPVPERVVEQPAAPAAIVPAPIPRFDPAAHAAALAAQMPLMAVQPAPVRKTRIVFSSDKIGRIGTSCLNVVASDTLIALGFEADGDFAEPPANGLAEPITLTIAGKAYVVAHLGLTFQHAGVLWMILPLVPE